MANRSRGSGPFNTRDHSTPTLDLSISGGEARGTKGDCYHAHTEASRKPGKQPPFRASSQARLITRLQITAFAAPLPQHEAPHYCAAPWLQFAIATEPVLLRSLAATEMIRWVKGARPGTCVAILYDSIEPFCEYPNLEEFSVEMIGHGGVDLTNRRHAADKAIMLRQKNVGVMARRSNARTDPSGAASNHQHVGLVLNRNLRRQFYEEFSTV
jgi:hypothetical protein